MLTAMVDDDFIAIDELGALRDKAVFLEQHGRGEDFRGSYEVSDIAISVLKDIAIEAGVTRIGESPSALPIVKEYRHLHLWTRKANGWTLRALQLTPLHRECGGPI